MICIEIFFYSKKIYFLVQNGQTNSKENINYIIIFFKVRYGEILFMVEMNQYFIIFKVPLTWILHTYIHYPPYIHLHTTFNIYKNPFQQILWKNIQIRVFVFFFFFNSLRQGRNQLGVGWTAPPPPSKFQNHLLINSLHSTLKSFLTL